MLARKMNRRRGKASSLVVAFVAITAIVALVVMMFNFLNNQESKPDSINVEVPQSAPRIEMPQKIEVPPPSAPSLPNVDAEK